VLPVNKYEDIVMPEQHRHLASKYEDIVNLQGAEAYRGGRPPTACLLYGLRPAQNGLCLSHSLFCLAAWYLQQLANILGERDAYGWTVTTSEKSLQLVTFKLY